MKELCLPFDEREENLQRACQIAYSEALSSHEPVHTDFMGVPLVAIPSDDGPRGVRENWQKLFDQFLAAGPKPAEPAAEENAPKFAPDAVIFVEPAKKKWWHTWWGGSICTLVICATVLTFLRGIVGWYEDIVGSHEITINGTKVVTYDPEMDAIVLNFDALATAYGCAHDSTRTFGLLTARGTSPETRTLFPICEKALQQGKEE